VDELVRLTWEHFVLRDRSGQASITIKGKRAKVRTVPLDAGVRETLRAIQSTPAEEPIFQGKPSPYTDRGILTGQDRPSPRRGISISGWAREIADALCLPIVNLRQPPG
jgi:integrase